MKPAAQSFLRYPLNWAFDSPANVRVLRVLARHGGALSASTLASFTKMTKPSVLSALRQLIETGVVEALGSDRQHLYRFRESGRLGAALSALFATENERYREAIQAVRTAAEKAGVEAAWIYGSVARDEDRPESDIDVAIACPPGRTSDMTTALRDGLSHRGRDLGFTASVIGIDAEEVAQLVREKDPWWLAVRRDAITVMGPAPDSYFDKSQSKQRKSQ